MRWLSFVCLHMFAASVAAAPVEYAIDAEASRLEVHTKKAGFLARMGHTHDIRATTFAGTVTADPAQLDASRLELVVTAASLKVMDGGLSAKDKAVVQKNMESAQVLDVAKFPEIRFRTRAVSGQPSGAGAWKAALKGTLALHGLEKPLDVDADVAIAGDTLTAKGEVQLAQHDFGIKPFRAVMGAVGVADAVTVTFTIVARKKK